MCNCSQCQTSREWDETFSNLTPAQQEAVDNLREALGQYMMDRDYYRAIVYGTWPSADEVIEGARKKGVLGRRRGDTWTSTDAPPDEAGHYLVTVATDDGPAVDVLFYDLKENYWVHEGEPTFCHGYMYTPKLWMNTPAPGQFKEDHE